MVNKPKAFLSHSSNDWPTVEKVARELRAMAIEPWFYEDDIDPGDSIPHKLDQALAQVDYFLLFWSAKALNSGWVRAEYDAAFFRRADDESVLIVPVLLDNTELPPLLRAISHLDFRQSIRAGISQLKAFFGREGYGPEQPPRLLKKGPGCEQKLRALPNRELRLRLKARFNMSDVREVWIDTFNSSLDNDLPGMPIGVAVGEMILRADQHRVREDLIRSICANRPDVANN